MQSFPTPWPSSASVVGIATRAQSPIIGALHSEVLCVGSGNVTECNLRGGGGLLGGCNTTGLMPVRNVTHTGGQRAVYPGGTQCSLQDKRRPLFATVPTD